MEKRATTTSRTGSNNSTRARGWGLGAGGKGPQPLALSPQPIAITRGLTLVEVLISIAILAAGSVLIMQALARGASTLALAQRRMTAYSFAASKLADLQLAAAEGKTVRTAGQFGADKDRFEWHLDTSPLEVPSLQAMTLTVEWRQGGRRYESSFSAVQPVPPEDVQL